MTEDAKTEAEEIVARVLQAIRQGDRGLAVDYVAAHLERFKLLGKREGIAEMKQLIATRAA